MPKSRHRRPARKRQTTTSARPAKLELSSFNLGETNREGFIAAFEAAARSSVSAFPEAVESFKARFRDRTPLAIVASAAMYSLQGFVTDQGVTAKQGSLLEQYQVEMLQGLLLMVPKDEWGKSPITADVMQWVFDETPKLSLTFLYQRILSRPEGADDATLTTHSLQERIRFHTQIVRNWGYYNDVIEISKEVYRPMDSQLLSAFGFGVVDLIDIMASIVREYERRANEHFAVLRKVLRAGSVRQMVRHYFKYVPDLVGGPEELLSSLPGSIDRSGMASVIMQHFDLRLPDRATFTPAEVAAFSGRSEAMAESVLRSLSLSPGELKAANPDHIFLSNPVWTAPGIDLGDRFFIALPQVIFSHIHAIVRKLAEGAKASEALERARARFLESKLEATLKSAFPNGRISAGVKWKFGLNEGETDILGVIGRVVLIAEAKSHRITEQALRGAPDRMRRHIQDLVLDPSLQSERLESIIEAARSGDADARVTMNALGVDADEIDHVIRISVTLDDLSVISSAEQELKAVGWIPIDHHLAPTIQLADLVCICDILNNPLLILHYLSERLYLQKTFSLMGDELDFLGLYLTTGFNIAGLESHDGVFSPSGMSAPLDRYYQSRDAGVKIAVPTANLQPLYKAIIDKLSSRRLTGWTTAGLHLLSSADPTEQRRIERAMNQLRVSVRKNHHDPAHVNSMIVTPPGERRAIVIFYVYVESDRANIARNMEQLAAEALESSLRSSCVVFARCVEKWNSPFEMCLLVGPKIGSDGPDDLSD